MKKNRSLLHPQLEMFLAVAKNKTMHGAAKVMHLSQTAVTKRIRSLESYLRTTLFIRTRHGVYLTSDGEALLRYCYAAVELEGITFANINNPGLDTTVRIGISGPSSIMSSRIIPQCLHIMKKYARLFINFEINDSEERIKTLQTGLHQLVIIEPQFVQKEMQIKPLHDEKFLLVCSAKWGKRSLMDILQKEPIIDYSESDPTTHNYLKTYDLLKYSQAERHYVNRNESLINMFIEGFGYGTLTEEVAETYIENKKLIVLNQGKTYKNSLVLAWYERPEPAQYFLDIVQAIA